MSKPKKVEIDLNKPYEENDIKLRGTIIFCAVTFVTIVLSFAIIWVINDQVEKGMAAHAEKTRHPMAMDKEALLPPEPRLQSAPGFGVGEGTNRVNLELAHPAAEWIELNKRWNEEIKHGKKDPATGAVVTMPVADAKAKLLEMKPTQRPDADAAKSLDAAKSYYTDASSGRGVNTK